MDYKDTTFKVKRKYFCSWEDGSLHRTRRHNYDCPYYMIEDSKGGEWEFMNSATEEERKQGHETYSYGKIIESFPVWFRYLFNNAHAKTSTEKLPPSFNFGYEKIEYKHPYWKYLNHLAIDVFPKLVKNWEISKDLNPSTAKTFEELINEL